jgi:hypothetical protein
MSSFCSFSIETACGRSGVLTSRDERRNVVFFRGGSSRPATWVVRFLLTSGTLLGEVASVDVFAASWIE